MAQRERLIAPGMLLIALARSGSQPRPDSARNSPTRARERDTRGGFGIFARRFWSARIE